MPRSKHRRKPAAKARAHPGRQGQIIRSFAMTRWHQFATAYQMPFHATFTGDPPGADALLDIIAFEAFTEGGTRPVSRAEAFRQFMEFEATPEAAAAALTFLVEQRMVEVRGDEITVPSRFWAEAEQSH